MDKVAAMIKDYLPVDNIYKSAAKELMNPKTGITKKKRVQIPLKKMWYLPITDRFKKDVSISKDSLSMRWHAEHLRDLMNISCLIYQLEKLGNIPIRYFQVFCENLEMSIWEFVRMDLNHMEYFDKTIRCGQ